MFCHVQEALLDIMHAFPRSVFSESELEATLWFTSKCGVEDLLTVQQVKSHQDAILEKCGVSPRMVEGKLSHRFALNDFEKIVAHMCWFLIFSVFAIFTI
jgi:hypothetical protein